MAKRIDLVATDLARKIWRLEGRCEHQFCENTKGDAKQLHGAHIYGVGAYPRLRADLRNGLSLCSLCHRRFTDNPVAFADWIRTTKYEKYLQPLRDKNNGPKIKVDWDDRILFLKDIHRQITAGEMTLDEARAYDEASQ
jgi:hypothetical protein